MDSATSVGGDPSVVMVLEEPPLRSMPEKSTLTFFPRVRDNGVAFDDNDESPSRLHKRRFLSRDSAGAVHFAFFFAVDAS